MQPAAAYNATATTNNTHDRAVCHAFHSSFLHLMRHGGFAMFTGMQCMPHAIVAGHTYIHIIHACSAIACHAIVACLPSFLPSFFQRMETEAWKPQILFFMPAMSFYAIHAQAFSPCSICWRAYICAHIHNEGKCVQAVCFSCY